MKRLPHPVLPRLRTHLIAAEVAPCAISAFLPAPPDGEIRESPLRLISPLWRWSSMAFNPRFGLTWIIAREHQSKLQDSKGRCTVAKKSGGELNKNDGAADGPSSTGVEAP